jgi:hypothetical protein
VFVFLPVFSYLIYYAQTVYDHKFRDWRLTLFIFLRENSSRIALRTFILSLLLGINQV